MEVQKDGHCDLWNDRFGENRQHIGLIRLNRSPDSADSTLNSDLTLAMMESFSAHDMVNTCTHAYEIIHVHHRWHSVKATACKLQSMPMAIPEVTLHRHEWNMDTQDIRKIQFLCRVCAGKMNLFKID